MSSAARAEKDKVREGGGDNEHSESMGELREKQDMYHVIVLSRTTGSWASECLGATNLRTRHRYYDPGVHIHRGN